MIAPGENTSAATTRPPSPARLRVDRDPVLFGSPDRPLIGMLHSPASATERRTTAALLCTAMGQESIRAHRAMVTLADRLARVGIPALRFDYFGTGDSGGDDEEGELDGWRADILRADIQLRAATGADSVAWIGLRLGAVLAATASTTAPRAPEAVFLWDPVLDGRAYLAELAQADRRALMYGFSADLVRYRALARTPVPEVPTEALGFELSERLRHQLLQLEPTRIAAVRANRLVVTASTGSAATREFLNVQRSCGVDVSELHIGQAIDWATNDAAGSVLVPADVFETIVRLLLLPAPYEPIPPR
jgi:pimeloyl-ACP methyl ester carboxylesterase